MESTDIFSLAKHEGPYESWPATTDLYVNGRPSGARPFGIGSLLKKRVVESAHS